MQLLENSHVEVGQLLDRAEEFSCGQQPQPGPLPCGYMGPYTGELYPAEEFELVSYGL